MASQNSPDRAFRCARSGTEDRQAIDAQLAKLWKCAASQSYTLEGKEIDGPTCGQLLTAILGDSHEK